LSRDLKLYLSPLPATDQPDLPDSDDRLVELRNLIQPSEPQESAFGKAADIAESVANDGIYDIRAIVYLLLGAFWEGGIKALFDVAEVVTMALGTNAAAIGPKFVSKPGWRKDTWNKRLSFLFGTIRDKLIAYEKSRGERWDILAGGVDVADIQHVMEALSRAEKVLTAEVYTESLTQVAKIQSFLQDLAGNVAAEQKAEEVTKKATNAGKEAKDITPTTSAATTESATNTTTATPPAVHNTSGPIPAAQVQRTARSRVELVVSPQFVELVEKLRAFEALLEKRHLQKAAVVAEDLQTIIQSFDPRVYFPELFSRFTALYSRNVSQLGEYMDDDKSREWKALEQFYRVDLDSFVRE